MRFILTLCAAVILGVTAFAARAQTVVNIVSQTCNVALTACVLQGDGGQTIAIDPETVVMTVNSAPYAGSVTSTTVESLTNYRRIYDVTMTFTPTAVMTAVHSFSRSGSGRGGWTWHEHWVFEALTVY